MCFPRPVNSSIFRPKAVLLLMLCRFVGAHWCVENPVSSIVPRGAAWVGRSYRDRLSFWYWGRLRDLKAPRLRLGLTCSWETAEGWAWLGGDRHCTCTRAFPAVCPQVHCHDRLKKFLATVPHHVASTWLGMYGGKSPKCVRLWCSDSFVRFLHRTPLRTGLMIFRQI